LSTSHGQISTGNWGRKQLSRAAAFAWHGECAALLGSQARTPFWRMLPSVMGRIGSSSLAILPSYHDVPEPAWGAREFR
jgi:hypothetical protein